MNPLFKNFIPTYFPLFPPALGIDGYKADHRRQYPDKTELVVSNLTSRSTRRGTGHTHIVYVGGQYFMKRFLIEEWNNFFFSQPKEEVVAQFTRFMNAYLGPDNQVGFHHIAALHDLGYLPIKIMTLPEGTVYPLRVPCLVIWNTLPEFFWLTNYLETILSTCIWGICTSATTALSYRKLLEEYAMETVGNTDFVPHQAHDFSFRGMFGPEAAMMSDFGHICSFVGTDTIPGLYFAERFYNANIEKELVGCSVPATEHSVMCAGEKENELETFRRLVEDLYPKGIISIVSDTWDFWQVLEPKNGILVQLRDKIMARDGKVVIRPDTGDPIKIVCGDPDAPIDSPAHKGAIQCLYEIFGGTVTAKGYRALDSHIGLIYGDSITLERAFHICEGLKRNRFATTNIVFGIGSYTYAYVTRDTDGYAVKATWVKVDGENREIFKDPKTGDGTKKSAMGLVAVYKDEKGEFYYKDQATWEELENCELKLVFEDGKMVKECSLQEIRDEIKKY